MPIKSNRYVVLLATCLPSLVQAVPYSHICESGAQFCTAAVNFGVVEISKISAAKTVILSNTGDSPLNITNMEITGEFSLGETYTCYNTGSNCAKPALPCTTIAPGDGCTFNVWYAPVTNPGANQNFLFSTIGALKFTTNASKTDISISLIGTTDTRGCAALPAPNKVLADTALGANSTTLEVIIPSQTTVQSLEIFTTGDFSQNHNCGNSLEANKTCPVTITFTPSVTGIRYGQLYSNRNARNCGIADFTLQGTSTGTNLNGPAAVTTPKNPVAPTKGDSGGGTGDTTTNIKGCTMGNGAFDPVLILLLLVAMSRLHKNRVKDPLNKAAG
jgi:hypothetical protein